MKACPVCGNALNQQYACVNCGWGVNNMSSNLSGGAKLLLAGCLFAFILPLLTCGACVLAGGATFDSHANQTAGDLALVAVYGEWAIALILLFAAIVSFVLGATDRRKK